MQKNIKITWNIDFWMLDSKEIKMKNNQYLM